MCPVEESGYNLWSEESFLEICANLENAVYPLEESEHTVEESGHTLWSEEAFFEVCVNIENAAYPLEESGHTLWLEEALSKNV